MGERGTGECYGGVELWRDGSGAKWLLSSHLADMTATIDAPATATTGKTPISSGATHAPRSDRLLSLDVFRGLTVAGMLLVNQPGDWGAIYPPLEHAAWNGWTPTDLIFPFFLFIVGVTTHLSIETRRRRGEDERAIVRQIARRGALIVLCGLLLASFPWWPIERITTMRFPGVLQRIGVAYFFGAPAPAPAGRCTCDQGTGFWMSGL